jgi:GT2 family glycosyltransferase
MIARLQSGSGAVGHDLLQTSGRLASVGGIWKPWTARSVSIDRGKPRRQTEDPAAVEARMNYIIGASMLVSRAFLDRVGEMREDYFLYCEETEWCLRAIRAGEKLGYAKDAVVLHIQGVSTGGGGGLRQQSKMAVYLGERNRILLTRDLYPARLPVTLPLSLTHLVLRYGKARAWSQLGFALSGWLAGLRNERGQPGWLLKAARHP